MARTQESINSNQLNNPVGYAAPSQRPLLLTIGICVVLAAMVWLVFSQTLGHEFVNYDDNEYVYENPNVSAGFSAAAIEWAFRTTYANNWHPLTTLSHMLDCQLYGLQPWGHHRTNVWLHAVAVVLLFLLLRDLTGSVWRSALVAALFAIHPLRVESVAWISERKDLLSGIFFILTIWAYIGFARSDPASPLRYGLALVLFALGLMSKPTLVTVPFVLLLLDYWPLERVASEGRTSLQQWGYLILEKIPFLVFSAASSAITVVAQSAALVSISNLNLKQRIAHAPIAYVIYLLQTIFPADLAVFYPFSTAHISMTYAIPAMVFLAAVSVLFFFWRKQHPYLLVGWLWFLGVLFPMIGIVQVGPQSHADRYTYLAQIGLFVCAIWGITALVTKWNLSRPAVNLTALGVTAALTFASYSQTSVWQNSETLWKQALATTANSHVAENNFGKALLHQQRADEALLHFENAIRIYPNYPEANNNLGYVLAHQGNCSEAIVYYEIALKNEPTLAPAHNNLGFCLVQMGMIKEATKHFRAALQLDPRFVDAHLNLATALLQLGETDEAVTHFKEVLRLNPNDAQVREQLRALGVSE